MPEKKHKLEIKDILNGSWQIIDCEDDAIDPQDLSFTGSSVASLVLDASEKLSFPHQIIQLVPESASDEERWELRFVNNDLSQDGYN